MPRLSAHPCCAPAHRCPAFGASLPFVSGRGRRWDDRSGRPAGGLGGFWEVGSQVALQGGGIDPWQKRWGWVPVSSRAGDLAFIGPTESGNRRGSSRDGRGRIRSSPISPGCPSKVIVPATPLDSRSSTRLSGRTSERPGILLGANGRLRLPSGPPAMPTRHPQQWPPTAACRPPTGSSGPLRYWAPIPPSTR